jgi:predicted permease
MSPGELWRRIHYLLNRSRLERELEEEMAAHRAMKGSGEPRFGNARRLREDAHDAWGWAWWDQLVQDLTFGSRMLRKSPAFTLTAIAILAIGVGMNIAAFQILNSIALTPLPVSDPDSLVRFNRRSPQGKSTSFAYPALDFYATHNTVLTSSMGILRTLVALESDTSRGVPVQFVTANYLSELGAIPALGRLLDGARDDEPDAEPVIVLTSSLWQGRFGSDPGIVGRTIRINGRPFTVAGVLPASFVGLTGRSSLAWIPITKQPYAFPGSDLLTSYSDTPVAFYARMKPGLGLRAIEDGLRSATSALRQRGPDAATENEWLEAIPAGRFVTVDADGIAIAATFTLIVLIAACANLATLIFARGFSREQEIGIRLSVGASRRRLVRQLLTESVMLAVLGTAAALGVSFVTTRLFLAGSDAPSFMRPTLDVRVTLFAFVMAALASVLFGLMPALQAVKPRTTHTRARTRGVLVAAQVAAGCTLLVVSALLTRALDRVVHAPLGFEYEHHVTLDPDLNASGVKGVAARAYWTGLRDRLTGVPGVREMSLETIPPLGNRVTTARIGRGRTAFVHHVDPTYFGVMGIPLRRGRLFQSNETGAAMVSESFAHAVWPGEDPLGKAWDEATVVGVVGNAATTALASPEASEFYHPMDDEHMARAVMIVRVAGDPSSMTGVLVGAARGVDPRVSLSAGVLLQAFDVKLRMPQRMTKIVWALGALALALAAVGLGGLVVFTVSQRAREIGIRMALGARSRDVINGVLQQFRRPIAWGLAGGFLMAAGLSRVLHRELFGLSPFDPVSYISAAALFTIVAALATAGPLRRALKVDPISALKCE